MTVEEARQVRRRPRNRRQLVVDAAGVVFGEKGYHAASMEEVAAKVGITAAALYRHFPNKYALFAECATVMVDRLQDVLDDLGPDVPFAAMLPELARVTVEHRSSGGIYRWEARFLEPAERRELRGKFARVVDATTYALERDLGGTQARLRASAALGVIGSITTHRTAVARQRLVEMLAETARATAGVDLSRVPASASEVDLPVRPEPVSRRGEILQAALPLFAQHGYRTVSTGEIAAALGIGPSAIYRHYPAKADILAAACLQAAATIEQAVGQALHQVEGDRASLSLLAATYVAYSFENTDLISVAEAEVVGLPPELRRPVVAAQREHVALWEQRLRAARPELDARAAKVLVHAGLGAVVEAGRLLRWRDTPENRDAVTALMLGALGVRA